MAFSSDPDHQTHERRQRRSRLRTRRLLLACVAALCAVLMLVGTVRFNDYWKRRFDPLINRHASFYNLDPALVRSVIHEETYFRPWMRGDAGEIGLMQVTPLVAREWAAETGLSDLQRRAERDPAELLLDPERNIQIGCWYLEKLAKRYRDEPAALAMTLSAYNAGPSRVTEWRRAAAGANNAAPTEQAFVEHIGIASTRAYVTSIMRRYREASASEARRKR